MKKSFTLLELLIVIAILAILAGLLLPALGAARNKARSIECLGNLRQNALAMQMYSMDFGGHVVTYTKDSSKATIPWTMILFEGKYVPGTSYLKTKTFLCPALPPEGFVDPYRTYGSLRFNDMWEADYFENEKGWGNFCLRDVAMASSGILLSAAKAEETFQSASFCRHAVCQSGKPGRRCRFLLHAVDGQSKRDALRPSRPQSQHCLFRRSCVRRFGCGSSGGRRHCTCGQRQKTGITEMEKTMFSFLRITLLATLTTGALSAAELLPFDRAVFQIEGAQNSRSGTGENRTPLLRGFQTERDCSALGGSSSACD